MNIEQQTKLREKLEKEIKVVENGAISDFASELLHEFFPESPLNRRMEQIVEKKSNGGW